MARSVQTPHRSRHEANGNCVSDVACKLQGIELAPGVPSSRESDAAPPRKRNNLCRPDEGVLDAARGMSQIQKQNATGGSPALTGGCFREKDCGGRGHRVHAENTVTITKAPKISQLPLQRLWHKGEKNLESCTPDEQTATPHQPEKAWLLLGTARDGTAAVGLGRTGRIGRQQHRRLKPTVLYALTRNDGRAAGGRHKLVGIVDDTAKRVYRVKGLSADDLEDMEDIRIEAQAIGRGHQAIQTRYRFILNNAARDSGKTVAEEADEAEDEFLTDAMDIARFNQTYPLDRAAAKALHALTNGEAEDLTQPAFVNSVAWAVLNMDVKFTEYRYPWTIQEEIGPMALAEPRALWKWLVPADDRP